MLPHPRSVAITLRADVGTVQRSIANHIEYTLASSRFDFDESKAYLATAHSVRDRLIESWNDTNQYFDEKQAKRVAYLSLEFLMGRSMQNALLNMDLESNYRKALMELGYDLEKLYEEEPDAALGNGGLGRLAACFLDSMATLDLPAWGYGIRYTYGIFKQLIRNGAQVEVPDYWLTFGNPWEIERCVHGLRACVRVCISVPRAPPPIETPPQHVQRGRRVPGSLLRLSARGAGCRRQRAQRLVRWRGGDGGGV